MPINKQDYHPNWPTISLQVRAEADQKCEWCGAPNGEYISRFGRPLEYKEVIICGEVRKRPTDDFTVWKPILPISARDAAKQGFTKVILTVAHLDRTRDNNERDNLAALCQRCHLNHDRQAQHIPHRKYGRHHDREQQTKLAL